MDAARPAMTGFGAQKVRRPEFVDVLARAMRTRAGLIGLLLTTAVVGIAIVGPFVAPGSPTAFVTAPFAPPSAGHWLGADVLGRDVLVRVLHGGLVLLLMAALSTVFGVALGAAVGIAAAYLRGWWDTFITWIADVMLAFPLMVLALLLVSVIGPSFWIIVVAITIGHVPQVARVIRSSALDVSERDFIKASELIGIPSYQIMWRGILPSVVTPLMVEAGLRLTLSIIIIAGLCFLGFGQQPPAANWGLMINENRIGIAGNPLGVLVPVLLIAVLTVGTNTFTDAIARVARGGERVHDFR